MTLFEGVPLGVFITVLLSGLLFFFAWNRLLRREINERMQAEDALRREISERSQAEEALRASEERFKDFAEAAADWFWEKDEDFKFTYLSERFQESTGWTPEKVLGRTLAECFSTPQADPPGL